MCMFDGQTACPSELREHTSSPTARVRHSAAQHTLQAYPPIGHSPFLQPVDPNGVSRFGVACSSVGHVMSCDP